MNLNLQQAFLAFLLIFFASGSSLFSQTLFYDIYKGEDRIGEIKVEKKISGNKVHYEANSEASFRVVFKNNLNTHTSAGFVDDELEYSMSKIVLNDKIREHSVTKKEGDYYNYFKHPKTNIREKRAPFPISSILLYYAEPVGIDRVFSENYQEMCDLKPISDHAYELALPGGKINQYIYKNGQLVEIKVIRTFVDLSFRLKSSS